MEIENYNFTKIKSQLDKLTKGLDKTPTHFKMDKVSTIDTSDNRDYKGYKICDNPSCFCTGNCISRIVFRGEN